VNKFDFLFLSASSIINFSKNKLFIALLSPSGLYEFEEDEIFSSAVRYLRTGS